MTAAQHRNRRTPLLAALTAAMAVAGVARAQGAGMTPNRTIEVRQEAASMEDKVGAVIPTDVEFVDERGYPFAFRQLFPGDRPVLLVPGYYCCPSMCGQVMDGMLDALNDVALTPGDDYLIVNVSIDPREDHEVALARKQAFLPKLHRVGGDNGWRFLTGAEREIRRLCDTVGFRYFWAEHDNRYAHPGALLFVTPQGRLSRVITGTVFDAGDVRQALVEASEGRLGGFWDEFRMSCLTWDPRTQSYTLTAMTIMRVGGAVTVVGLALMIVLMIRREKRKAARGQPDQDPATRHPATPHDRTDAGGAPSNASV